MATVTVFGSSQVKEGEPEYEQARDLGRQLAESGYTLCNGGYGGIMEASARGAKEAGGHTLGITTEDFGGPANRWIDREIRVKRWSERLFKLIETGDAYVVLDGGTGTLVELFVLWEMSNKKFLHKPMIVLGSKISALVHQIRKWPQVITSKKFFFVNSPKEIMEIFNKNQALKEDV